MASSSDLDVLLQTWQPCTQMKTFEHKPPLSITQAKGATLELASGNTLVDAISSWWCKSLGHNHAEIREALLEQADSFEHVMLPNTTHPALQQLSARLAALLPSLDRVFYAGDGCCAVEIAMKMSLHTRKVRGETRRSKFIALENAYHGDTCGAMSVSHLGKFKQFYHELTFDSHFIRDIPYVSGEDDPLWHDCSVCWPRIAEQLEPLKDTANALVLEPLIQGAGGMKVYSADFLRRLSQWCRHNNVYLIADEIMTGIGRTGYMLACEHAGVVPDFVCLSKGLTSGWLAMSAVLTHQQVSGCFYGDQTAEAFLHSHTYSGNALAVKVADTVLQIFARQQLCRYVREQLAPVLHAQMRRLAQQSGILRNVRLLGGVAAADVLLPATTLQNCFRYGVEAGILLRPLDNTLYWAPPLNSNADTLAAIGTRTEAVLNRLAAEA